MRPLRFCMVTTFYPPYHFGGDAMEVQRLSRALVRRGHHVTVVHDASAYRLLAAGAGPMPVDAGADDGVEVVTLDAALPVLPALLTQQTGRPVLHGRRLRRLLEDGAWDVVHYHNVSLIGGPGVLSYGHALKLYSAHEHWLVCPTHVLWRHGREACPERECVRCQLRHRRPPQLWRGTDWYREQLRHVDAFIAKSEFSRDKHREFGFEPDMEVVPCFLPDVEPAPAALDEPPQERPYFLFVGRLERIKGLDDVIPLFGPGAEADLVVAGTGTHEPELRRLAAGSPRVRFVGTMAPAELRRHYRHALALVAPSVCFETFGLTLIEAFREGTPVLARRIGPFPEVVGRCGGGELFGDAAELGAALERLLRDPDHRARLARAARAGFLAHWSEEAVLPQHLEVVRRAAERRGDAELARSAATGVHAA